jgi:uncharacterized membrane protein YhaH (DUF805 family)
MLHYYKLYWLNAFKIHGRARRKEFWYPVLVNIIITIIAGVLDTFLPIPKGLSYTIGIIFSIANYIPGFTVMVRRFHDIGMTMKIPVILYIFMILDDISDVIPKSNFNFDLNFNNALNITISIIIIVIVAAFLILCIFSLAACCTRGNEDSNKYGVNPKYVN